MPSLCLCETGIISGIHFKPRKEKGDKIFRRIPFGKIFTIELPHNSFDVILFYENF